MKRAFALICLAYAILMGLMFARTAGAARLELRHTGTGVPAAALDVGDEFDVELWIDSEGEPLSGATVFLSFDERHFALVDEDRDPISQGFQPFAPGAFLGNGETFRNVLLDEDDPAASLAGVQLDYSIVRADGAGSGILASLRLRALAPTAASPVRIDENGIRETRVFRPDGSHRPFRFIAPLQLTVRGITLADLPQRLVLARGQTDSTSLDLGRLVADPLYGADDIDWTFSSPRGLDLHRDAAGRLVLTAPADASLWDRLVLTATNPDGHTARDTVEIFVNAPPQLAAVPDGLVLREDTPYEWALDGLVVDPDAAPDGLTWQIDAPEQLAVNIQGPPYRAQVTPQRDWHGQGQIRLQVTDEFGFADAAALPLEVTPVNDPPRLLFAPNIRLTRGRQDSSLALVGLLADADDALEDLDLQWSAPEHIDLARRGGRLVIGSRDTWLGTEEILLTAVDAAGLRASALLTVTVAASLPPILLDPPARLALSPGQQHILELAPLATDPDDGAAALRWELESAGPLTLRLSEAAVRLEAPADFSGTQTLRLRAIDPSGETAHFDLLVFAAPADGSPVLTALPTIEVPLDGVHTDLDLDDYAFDSDHPVTALEWIPGRRDDVDLRVDPTTHVLTVDPTDAALPGLIEVEIRLRDPDGHEVIGLLYVRLTGTAPEPLFGLARPAPLELAPDQRVELPLDPLVEGDIDPATLEWSASGDTGIDLEIDAVARRLTVRARRDWSGTAQITLTARGASGPPQQQTLDVTVAAPVQLQLAEMPPLSLRPGQFDRSLDLDDYVSGIDPAALQWTVEGDHRSQILIDAETHRLIVLPPEDWSGTETVRLSARDALGNSAEVLLYLEVLAAAPVLSLPSTLETALFAGDTRLRLDLDALLPDAAAAASLVWQASGQRAITATYDGPNRQLLLDAATPWTDDALITLTARDAQGNQATTQIAAHVHALDGSAGQDTEGFRLSIVPNPVQPDYLDLYIWSDSTLARTPRLRLQQDTDATAWQELDLEQSANGLWFGRHVLASGQEGNWRFLALGMDQQQQLWKSEFALGVGTVTDAAAKRVASGPLAVEARAASGQRAVIALLPASLPPVPAELSPAAPAYRIHSSGRLAPEAGRLYLPAVPGTAVYRWDAALERWDFVGGKPLGTHLQAPLPGPGIYALLRDQTPPRLASQTQDGTRLYQVWRDRGSGMGDVFVTGLTSDAYTWDGLRLAIDRTALSEGLAQVQVIATDRQGNRTALQLPLPRQTALHANFPNPFNPATTLPFSLGAAAAVRLEVFNAAGQRVRLLFDGELATGDHRLAWDARDDRGRPVAAGVYLYRLHVGDRVLTRKMTLAR